MSVSGPARCGCGREQALDRGDPDDRYAFLHAIGWRGPVRPSGSLDGWRCPFCAGQAQAHDYLCEPWQPPYGIKWTCQRCGHNVCQSLVVLSDPDRLRSTAACLDGACSGRRRAAAASPQR